MERSIRESEYHFSLHKDGLFQAPNRANGLRIGIGETRVVVTSRMHGDRESEGGFLLDLDMVAWGRVGSLLPVGRATRVPHGERVDLGRGALTEWYINTPDGLEQGITLRHPPPETTTDRGPDPPSPLVIEFAVHSSLGAYPSEDGREILFKDGSGAPILRYADLCVTDATGAGVPARLAFERGRLQIRIDDRDAVWPLEVDPLLNSAAWTAEGDQVGAWFGIAVGTAGDVNGDGYSDVIVGASLFDNGQTDEGRAYVYHGSASGLSATPAWTAESNQTFAEFGFSVGTAGDVNGDGYSDVIVGAHYFDNPQADEGRAHVYHGSASGLSATPAWTAESNQAGAEFGSSVGTAGDVNGDGYSDVVVGASRWTSGQALEGRAYVYHGSATGLSTGFAWAVESNQSSAAFGISVGTAGDVNGNGYSDVIVGAWQFTNGQLNEGRAYVYHGSASGLSTAPAWTAESDQENAYFGGSAGTAGDVNGDGYSDVIVGAYAFDNGQTSEGRAFVYHGSASGLGTGPAWTAESDQAGAEYGKRVGAAGDVEGDGYSDVIVGALGFDNDQTDEGRVFMYQGSASGLAATPAWTAESNQAGPLFGSAVGTAGDVNGDGNSDVIVGARGFGNGQASEGRAFVYHGFSTAVPSGSVPDGSNGPPLQLSKASGSDITLSWGASCVGTDTDYEIYAGILGSYYSHGSLYCSTGGATTKTFTPAASSVYYLVVSRNAQREGSYGKRTGGIERPVGLNACRPQQLAACP